jgi:hypothetical protein
MTAADSGPSLAADRASVHLFHPETGESLRG